MSDIWFLCSSVRIRCVVGWLGEVLRDGGEEGLWVVVIGNVGKGKVGN